MSRLLSRLCRPAAALAARSCVSASSARFRSASRAASAASRRRRSFSRASSLLRHRELRLRRPPGDARLRRRPPPRLRPTLGRAAAPTRRRGRPRPRPGPRPHRSVRLRLPDQHDRPHLLECSSYPRPRRTRAFRREAALTSDPNRTRLVVHRRTQRPLKGYPECVGTGRDRNGDAASVVSQKW
jgi:hypothetical protein